MYIFYSYYYLPIPTSARPFSFVPGYGCHPRYSVLIPRCRVSDAVAHGWGQVCVAVSSFSVSPGIRITCKETRAVALLSSSSPLDIRRVHSKMSVCSSSGTLKRWCISTPICVCVHLLVYARVRARRAACVCVHACVCTYTRMRVHVHVFIQYSCEYGIFQQMQICKILSRASQERRSPQWLDLSTSNALKLSRAMRPCSAPRGYAHL